MRAEVIEFELTCAACGVHRTLARVELPRPAHCVHCFLPVVSRREVRRLAMEAPLPCDIAAEVFIG